MKKKVIILAAAFCAVICLGIFLYFHFFDRLETVCIQKMYGSIGIARDGQYSFRLTLFAFNEDVDFLNDAAGISFDNPDVKITSVSFSEQAKEKDLTSYSVSLSIKIDKEGKFDVKQLRYKDKDTQKTLDMHCFSRSIIRRNLPK
ncbi:MAG: hypothetical protein IKX54_05360 [Lachnospiraceae bacterium]|nr:hypothetical protein [Lachnospiraceae bacterium]